jgi:mannose-6-phosphate isomerase-like protein (cupin superfamily)
MSYPDDRYLGEGGEVSAIYEPAIRTPELSAGNTGTSTHYLATGRTTNGQFGLYRWDMGRPPSGPSPHFHRSISESFFILSGTVRLYNGERWIDATVGDFLFVPEGGIHAFRNESGAPASMLILFAPGAPREDYFETLAEVGAGTRMLSEEEWAAFYLRHDTYWVD